LEKKRKMKNPPNFERKVWSSPIQDQCEKMGVKGRSNSPIKPRHKTTSKVKHQNEGTNVFQGKITRCDSKATR
jgi:hypothetical protein